MPRAKLNGKEYVLPGLDDLTFAEMRLFKKASDLTVTELEEAERRGDYDLILGLVAVAMKREDGSVDIDALLGSKFGAIELVGDDADPPPTAPASDSGGAS